MMASYKLWRNELVSSTPPERRGDRTTEAALQCGFWQIESARTKPSYPVAIFPQDGENGQRIIVKIGVGAKDGQSLFSDADTERFDDFAASTWLKCISVTEADYHAAMDSGRWPDGKPARQMSDTEKLDLVPDTPTDQGGNNPVGDDGEEIDLFHQQVVTKITAELDKAKAIKWPFRSLEEANKAAGIVETLRGLGKQGEAKRKEQKQPHLDAAAAVDAKWALLKDASALIGAMVTAIQSFRDAEELRLKREQDEAQRVERERLRKEAEETARREAEAAAREALARGEAFEEPTEEAIAEQAEAAADEAIAAAPPMPAPTVRVGTAHGKAISKPKRKVGKIVDLDKFIAAVKGQQDFRFFLEDKANKLARANTTLDGMEITEE